MNKTKKNLLFALVPSLLLSLVVLSQQQGITQEEVEDTNSQITGNVVNSIYLTIIDHSFSRPYVITGTIANNSTQEIEFPMVYAALYNANNQLIMMESGSVYVDSLPAGNNSTFDVPIFGSKDEKVDHYTLYPSGTPVPPGEEAALKGDFASPEGGAPPEGPGAIPGPILPE